MGGGLVIGYIFVVLTSDGPVTGAGANANNNNNDDDDDDDDERQQESHCGSWRQFIRWSCKLFLDNTPPGFVEGALK